MPEGVTTAFIAGVFAVIGSLVTYAFTADQRKSETVENDATAAARIAEAWQGLLAPLESRVKALEAENRELRAAVSALSDDNDAKDKRIKELEGEVAALQKELERFKRGRGNNA